MGRYDTLPRPVDRVFGAFGVAFPWDVAGSTVEELRDMADELARQFGSRNGMRDDIEDWAGVYRTQFDTKYAQLAGAAGGQYGLTERLRSAAQRIVDAANEVNAVQGRNNDQAEGLPHDARQQREREWQATRPG